MIASPGRPPGSSCMVCRADLWDVERYVSAGPVVICQDCVRALGRAVEEADRGVTEVVLPPRVHGSAPDDVAPGAVANAFVMTFQSGEDRLDDVLEDAPELGALLSEGENRYGPATRFGARVDAMRFPRPDLAEVRFQILMNGAPTGIPFQGTAARHDGHWRVTRETIAHVLSAAGVSVPPHRA